HPRAPHPLPPRRSSDLASTYARPEQHPSGQRAPGYPSERAHKRMYDNSHYHTNTRERPPRNPLERQTKERIQHPAKRPGAATLGPQTRHRQPGAAAPPRPTQEAYPHAPAAHPPTPGPRAAPDRLSRPRPATGRHLPRDA